VFERRYNPALVRLARVTDPADVDALRAFVEAHRAATGSERARTVLAEWNTWLPLFWKVAPEAVPVPKAAAPARTGSPRAT